MGKIEVDRETIYILAKRNRITQKDLAQRSGVSRNTISVILRGAEYCQTKTAEKIAAALDVPVDRLIKKSK